MSKDLRLQVLLDAIDKASAPFKKVMGASDGLAKSVKAARDRLKEMERANAKMDAFRDTARAISVKTNAINGLTPRLKALKEEIAATSTPSKALVREFERVRNEAQQLKGAKTKLLEKAQRLRAELEQAGTPTRELARHQTELRAKMATANAALAEQEKRLKKNGEAMRRMSAARAQYDKAMERRNKLSSAGMGMMTSGAAVTGAVAAPVLAFAAAEDARTQLQVAMMGKGGTASAQYQQVAELAERLGNRLPGTTADFQNMMTMLIRQGMTTQAILGGLGEATAYLGVQLKMPFTEAAEFAAKLQDATRTTENEMMGLMDTIQRTFYLGVDSGNMLQGFAKLSPLLDVVKKKGLEFTNMMAPLLVMADQAGMSGESAGNAYRKIFQYALDTKKLGDANDILGARGIKLDFSDGKGEFGGLDRMFEQLSQLKNLDTQTRLAVMKKLFGDDAETLQAVGLMIDKGASGYKETQAKMAAQASIQERVNVQLGTLKNLWDAASGTFVNVLVAFGESIAPELKALTEWIGKVSERLQAWAKNNPGLASALMKTTAAVGLLLLALGGLAMGAAAILGPFAMLRFGLTAIAVKGGGTLSMLTTLGRSILPMVGQSIMVIGRALMLNPIGLTIAAIGLAALLIYKYWGPISGYFIGLWEGLKEGLAPLWDAFSAAFAPLAPVLRPLGDLLAKIWGWFVGLVTPIDDTGGAARSFGQQVGYVVGFVIRTLLTIPLKLAGLYFEFVRICSGIIGAFLEIPNQMITIGGQIMDGLWQGLSSRWEGLKAKVAEIADSVSTTVKGTLGIHSPSRVFAEIGGYTMQGLQLGLQGAAAGPLAVVSGLAANLAAAGAIGLGAASPALAVDNRPALVAGASAPALAGGGSVTINVYPSPGMDEEALADLVAQKIAEAQRNQAASGRSRLTDSD